MKYLYKSHVHLSNFWHLKHANTVNVGVCWESINTKRSAHSFLVFHHILTDVLH